MSIQANMKLMSATQTPPPYPAQTYAAPSLVHHQNDDTEIQQNDSPWACRTGDDQPQARNLVAEKMSYGQGQSYESLFSLKRLGSSPSPVKCPHCNHRGITRTEFHSGNYTHVLCLGISCFACLCCWIPYVVNSAKDVDHFCEQCNARLVTWHRSGRTEVVRDTQKRAMQV